jgi:hypothetical protein
MSSDAISPDAHGIAFIFDVAKIRIIFLKTNRQMRFLEQVPLSP